MTKGDGPTSSNLAASAPSNNHSETLTNGQAGVKTSPRDTTIVTSILNELGITEYEPRVVHQLLEFTYRYTTDILEDAQMYSSYAKKKTMDVKDIKLAIQMQVERRFTSPTPRDVLAEIARQKNSQPLPLIRSHTGLRLPPDRYSLVACNYRLKNSSKLRTFQQQQMQQQQQQQQQQQHILQLGPQSNFQLPIRTLQGNSSITLSNLPKFIEPSKATSMITIPTLSTATRITAPTIVNITKKDNPSNNPPPTNPPSSDLKVKDDNETNHGTKRKLEESEVNIDS